MSSRARQAVRRLMRVRRLVAIPTVPPVGLRVVPLAGQRVEQQGEQQVEQQGVAILLPAVRPMALVFLVQPAFSAG